MKPIASNWNLFQFIRLFLGIAVVVKGIMDGETMFAFAGSLIAFMALANIGCCGTSGCALPKSRRSELKHSNTKVFYEEVDPTK